MTQSKKQIADRKYYLKNKEKHNKQCREYYQKHKEEARIRNNNNRVNMRIVCKEYLGGECVGCGTTENLQFDHIDRNLKEYSVGKRMGNTFAYLKPELDKCQLLCKQCHQIKSQINHDHDKLAEGYRVTNVSRIDDKIVVTLEKGECN